MAIYEPITLYGPLAENRNKLAHLTKDDIKVIFDDILMIHQGYVFFEKQIDKQQKLLSHHVASSAISLIKYLDLIDTVEFMDALPEFSSQRTTKETMKLAKEIANIYSKGMLSLEIIKDGLLIFTIKQRQLMLEGLPLNQRLLMETFWSIDRTMPEILLSYWIKKFSIYLEMPNLLASHEYLYLLINTFSKKDIIEKCISKPVSDVSRDPKNFNAFKMLSQQDLKNQRSVNIQIQTYFNMVYSPAYATLVSKFEMKESTSRQKELKLIEKNANPSKATSSSILKHPGLYPEISAKISGQSKLIMKSKYRQPNQAAPISDQLEELHNMRFSEDIPSVELYLNSNEGLAKKWGGYRGYQYKYYCDMIQSNIDRSEGLWERAEENSLKKQLEQGLEQSGVGSGDIEQQQPQEALITSSKNVQRLKSASSLRSTFYNGRESTSKLGVKNGGKKSRLASASTRVDSIMSVIDKELDLLEGER